MHCGIVAAASVEPKVFKKGNIKLYEKKRREKRKINMQTHALKCENANDPNSQIHTHTHTHTYMLTETDSTGRMRNTQQEQLEGRERERRQRSKKP